jgi:hypothetical protein
MSNHNYWFILSWIDGIFWKTTNSKKKTNKFCYEYHLWIWRSHRDNHFQKVF